MISKIEALNYRCLRFVSQEMQNFHVLVGPNACGKSTFLDIIGFLGQLVSEGLEIAVSERTNNFQDLVWMRSGTSFELAIDMEIPEERQKKIERPNLNTIRYEVKIGLVKKTGEVAILAEKVLLKERPPKSNSSIEQRSLFPMEVVLSLGSIIDGLDFTKNDGFPYL